MNISITPRTMILIFLLAAFGIGYTYAQNKVVVIPLGSDAAPTSFAVFAGGEQSELVTEAGEVVRFVTVSAPVDGVVIVNSTNSVEEGRGFYGVRCSITTGTAIDTGFIQLFESPGGTGKQSQMSGTRGFNITGGQSITYNLVCEHFGGEEQSSLILDSSLTAIFTPAQA